MIPLWQQAAGHQPAECFLRSFLVVVADPGADATRKVQVKWGLEQDSKPMPASVLYVVAFPLGKEPEQFATPKSAGIRL